MHTIDERINRMMRTVLALAENRLRLDPVPLDRGTRSADELQGLLDGLIAKHAR
jgi:aromatic-L-amino-acid decarboxylase